MAATWPLVRRGLRRTSGQHVVTLLLSVVAAIMLNIGLILGLEYGPGLEQRFDDLDSGDGYTIVTTTELATAATQFLRSRPEVTDVDVEPARVNAIAIVDYRGGEAITYAVFTDRSRPPALGRDAVVAELDHLLDDGIYVPFQVAENGGYALGDPITLQIGADRRTYHIQGTLESPFMGSLLLGTVAFSLPHAGYEAFAATTTAPQGWVVRFRTAERAQGTPVASDLTKHLQARGAGADVSLMPFGTTRDLVLPAMQVSSSLFSAMLIVFTLIVAGVVVAVIWYEVRAEIVRDMPAIGTLKATGDTSGHIVTAMTLQHVVSAAVGAALGVALSYVALPVFVASLAAQTGLRWEPGFQPVPVVVTVVTLVGAAALAGLGSALRVLKIAPVDALRGGFTTRSLGRNLLPLDTARGPLDALLGLKQVARRPAQTAMVALVIGLVTFTAVFTTASYGYLGDRKLMYDVSLGDWGDIWIGQARRIPPEELRTRLAAEPDVTAAYYDDMFLEAGSPAGTLRIRASKDYSILRTDNVVEGRAPQTSDEIAVGGKVITETGLHIGDTIELDQAGRKASYRITGVVQTGFGLGLAASVTTAGYQRLAPAFVPQALRLRVTPGADLDALMERIRVDYRGLLTGVIGSEAYRESMLGPLGTAMQGLAAMFLVVCLIVVVLVVGLVTSGTILMGRRESGIKKSLGFTTWQLTAQVLAGHVPQAMIGVVLGLLAGWLWTKPLVSLAGQPSGLVEVPVEAEPVLAGVAAAMLGLTVITIVLFSLRLRRVTAHALIRD